MVSEASRKKAAHNKVGATAEKGGKVAATATSSKSASEKAVDSVANGIGDIQIYDLGYYRLFDVGGGGGTGEDVGGGGEERERRVVEGVKEII